RRCSTGCSTGRSIPDFRPETGTETKGAAMSTSSVLKEKLKEKMKAVSTAIAAIEKQFGKGAIMPLGGGDVAEIEVIPTGSVGLDLALGVGGLPRGRVIEIYGP